MCGARNLRETKSAADDPLAQLLADERDHLAKEKKVFDLNRYRNNFLGKQVSTKVRVRVCTHVSA